MSGGRPAVGKTRPIVEEATRVGGGRGLSAQSHVEAGQRRPPAAAPGRRAPPPLAYRLRKPLAGFQ
jgi:hypothetical protein